MELLLDTLKWSVIVGTAALALTLLKPLLDRRYSAKWRYGVWLVMAAFLLLAPVQWEALVPERAAAVEPPVVIEVPKVEVSVSPQEGVTFQRPALTPQPIAAAAKKQAVLPLEKVLEGLWLAGVGLFFAYHLFGTWYFNRKARRWSRQAGEETLGVYEAVQREMGLKKAPPLRVSSAVDSPMVIGLFRPCLMLPGEGFGTQELAFILRHELTHCRRRDLWYKLGLLAANGMHWFNPLVWLMRREAERDLELTCDDAVVAGRDDMERRAYSEALLASIHRQKGLRRAVLSTHFYGGKEVMMERFRNILGKRGRKWGGLALALVLLATVAVACAVGVKPSTDGELTPEELAEWQEKIESPEMDHYIWKMYTDVSYLLSKEKLDEMFPVPEGVEELGHEDINPKVLSGVKSGDTVTLEIEGRFSSRLPTGTLTLVNEEPVSFTTPLYTAVETAARERMENTAESFISNAKEYGKDLEFTEKYVTNLFCSESMTFDGKTYYIWELYYVMKPNDIGNVVFAGDISVENGWLTTLVYPGTPILIFSVDGDGKIVLEEQTWSDTMGEEGYTWEEYVYCTLHLGMGQGGIMNGWPELNTPFLESLRDGHDTWALDWQDVAISYLSKIYGIYADSGVTSLRTFTADPDSHHHDEAVLVQAVCGDRTVTLLLAHINYPVEVWNTTMTWWQVVGEKWEPDRPQTVKEQNALPVGELTEEELAAITDYFNDPLHNGLLRYPYSSLGAGTKYLDILLYDLGQPVTDQEERDALAEAFFDGEMPDTDCLKLTRAFIQGYLEQNFGRMGNYGVETDSSDMWMAFDTLKRSESLPYLEEYDAWYMIHGDTMMSNYTFDRAERDEVGVVSLYYTTDLWQFNDSGELDLLWDQPMRAEMVLGEDGGWRMLSNQIAG
ncbi:MAG: M56 family metallopeptidase [Oscillospiraceae bacterium]|nr:M56 family metallopeptidase [Oscillospiraceae bacterium]